MNDGGGSGVAMTDDVAISMEGLWKRYGLPMPEFVYRGQSRLRSALRRRRGRAATVSVDAGFQRDSLGWALSGVNLTVPRGQSLGIIGRNGAGKSTLLKVLAGVTPPTRGNVHVRGQIFPMIELNAGINRELTGRENIYLLGCIMGFSRRAMRARLPEIEQFSELGEWLNEPARKYSSGMLARLGFSVAMNVDADVLLFDEVLAVGDMAFKVKCFERIEELRNSNATILFVSHSVRMVQRLCDQAVLLDKGRVISEGTADEVASDYYRLTHDRIAGSLFEKGRGAHPQIDHRTDDARIVGVSFIHGPTGETDHLVYLDPGTLRLHFEVRRPIAVPRITIGIQTPDLVNVALMTSSFGASDKSVLQPGRHYADCAFSGMPLFPGVYSLRVVIAAGDGLHHKIDQVENLRYFHVLPSRDHSARSNDGGYLRLEADWQLLAAE